jgi:RNA polymerase sigma-70 factor (ECF subfamily)
MSMGQVNLAERLSRISTVWTVLVRAKGGPEADTSAQYAVIERYHRVVYRYLLGILKDPDAASDLFQDFVVRFLEGRLRGADPKRGRFRDFLKGALCHLVADHYKRVRKRPQPLPPDYPEPATTSPTEVDHEDAILRQSVRDELLALTWAALAASDRATGQSFHTVLRLRSDHPAMRSPQMAEQLTTQLGKSVTPEWVRKMLQLARTRFAEFLVEEAGHLLQNPTDEQLEQELMDLGLLDFCRSFLKQRGGKG